MPKKLDFLNRLNPTQLEAVKSKASSLQILAGPGSGKTRVLTSRVAWLVEEEFEDPSRIVVATFTTRAAQEMKQRLESPELLGKVKSDQLMMGTFHNICGTLLRQYGGLIHVNSNFTVADADVSKHIIRGLQKELANELGDYGAKKMKEEAYLSEISRHKCRGIDVDTYCEMYQDKASKREFMIMFRAYEDRLLAENMVDFDNLLLFGREVIKRYPHVTSFVRHFLVDEFQDTNSVQYDIVRYATQAAGKNLTIVGDPDQSIYGWRNADRSNFLRMQQDFPNTEIIRLEENYRSTKTILNAALHVVAQDPDRIPKSLYTDNVEGIPVSFLRASTSELEAETVAQEIERLVKYSKGLLTYKDIAVLVRINFMTRSIEQSLNALHIPYVVVGGVRFFDRKEVKDIIAYVRFFYNPCDTAAFDRIINVPPRGIGESTLEKIRKLSRDDHLDIITVLDNIASDKIPIPGLSSRTKTNLRKFLQLCEEVRKNMFAGQAPSDIIRYIVDEIEYNAYLRKTHKKEKEGESRWANIGELISYTKLAFDPPPKDMTAKEAAAWEKIQWDLEEDLELHPEEAVWYTQSTDVVASSARDHAEQMLETLKVQDPVARFLEATCLNAANKEQEEAAGGKVTISTMHSAKGLEWPIVFVIGCENGIIPHRKSEDDPWEENRLLYVSMTRAQCHLYCTYSLKRPDFGYSRKATFSRFLQDMPADLRMHRTPNIDASMREMIASVTHRQKIEAYEDDDDDDDPDSMSKGEEIWVPEEVTCRDSRYGIPRNPPPIASSQSQKRSTQSQPYSTFSSATEIQRHKRLKQERNGRPIACAPTSLLSVNEALAFPSELKYEDDDIFSSQSAVTPALPGPSATALKTFGSQLPSTSLSKRSGSQPVSNAFTPILLQGIEDAVRDVISKGKRFTSDDVYTATDGLLRKMNVSLAQEAILENIELKLAEYVNQGHLEIVMSKSGRRYQIAED